MSWAGDMDRGVNLWRRWYLDHILPRPDGRPLKPMMACSGTDAGDEFTNATEENQIRYMDKFKKNGFDFDVWWIDAGWFPCYNEQKKKEWWRTGTWEPDYERFPNGFMPVSRHADENAAKLLLWFEPERVMLGDSRIEREHPEWLMEIKNSEEEWTKVYRLLNLGNSECRKWLTDYMCKFIQDNGVKIYRQDFNYPPLMFWQENEPEDRQGMNENLYIQGYLQYWDELLMRNPGLWIDSCASGGRRNDLETMRRSVPLHYSDYGYGNQPVKLGFQHTLYTWIPYFKEMALSWDEKKAGDDFRYDSHVDPFSFHCGMAPMLFIALDIRRDDYDYMLGTKMAGIWRKVSDMLLHGDYYPLTSVKRNTEEWVVRQFDVPETGKGLIQGIRHSACEEEAITVFPKVLYPGCTYSFENPETNETLDVCGSALLHEGFCFKLSKRSACLWIYSVKG
jgi:alpha-galactosidase